MRTAHHVMIKVFCKDGEDCETIKDALVRLSSIDEEQDKVSVRQQTATGFEGKTIRILTVNLERQPHIRRFLEHLAGALNHGDRSKLVNQCESRIDPNFHFFLRLDKQALLGEGKYQVVDHGDCFHVDIALACFPKKRENALAAVKEIFQEMKEH